MSKRSVEDALALAYSQQEEGNPLKPALVVLACELLRMRDRKRALVEALGNFVAAPQSIDIQDWSDAVDKACSALEAVKE